MENFTLFNDLEFDLDTSTLLLDWTAMDSDINTEDKNGSHTPTSPDNTTIDWRYNEEFQPLYDDMTHNFDDEDLLAALSEPIKTPPAEHTVDTSCEQTTLTETPEAAVPLTVFEAVSDENDSPPTFVVPKASTSELVRTGRKRKSTINVKEPVKVKPHESSKQAVRRVKNNIASREFRSRRKTKHDVMTEKVDELVQRNAELRLDVDMVEEVVRILKDGMIAHGRGSATK